MTDLMQSRISRAPQRFFGDEDDLLLLERSRPSAVDARRRLAPAPTPTPSRGTLVRSAPSLTANAYIQSPSFISPASKPKSPVRELDRWLARRNNRVSPTEISQHLQNKVNQMR
jgi:hypothetical protein